VSTGAHAAARPRTSVLLAWDPLKLAALFAGAALISGFTIYRGGAEFDEGVVLAAAQRVASGEVPYSDFLWPYGPAEPYIFGAWFHLLGPSLMSWRVLRVLCDASVALTVYVLVRRGASERLALIGWLTTACAMAQPTSAGPFPYGLLFSLLALLVVDSGGVGLRAAGRPGLSGLSWRGSTRSVGYSGVSYGASLSGVWRGSLATPVAAGALIALAAAWRLDFALYGGAAVVVALLLQRERRSDMLPFAGVAASLTLLIYLPFAIAAGPADLWEQLVAKSLREKEWWTLPFPFSYDGGFTLWPLGDFLEDVKDVLGYYVPLLVVIGLALTAVAAVRERLPSRLAGLIVLGAGGLAYLLSRADEFHATPLLVVLAAALPLCLAVLEPAGGASYAPRWAAAAPYGRRAASYRLRPRSGGSYGLRSRGAAAYRRAAVPSRAAEVLALAVAAVLALLLAYGVWNRLSALLRPPELVTIEVPVAHGAKARPREARGIEGMVGEVQRLVPPGKPIYATTRRSDLVAFNQPLIYVLTERPNATDEDFGLLATGESQVATVEALRRERPRAIVRWLDPISVKREDNKRGRSTGVRFLDSYLKDYYRPLRRYGVYQVLVPRR
jgi:hypothetical protein